MKKQLSMIVFAALVLQFTSSTAFAFDVIVQPNGSMQFFQGQVLGDDDEKNEAEEKSEPSESQKKQIELEKRQVEEQREAAKVKSNLKRKTDLIKTVPSTAAKRLRVKNTEAKAELMLEDRLNDDSSESSQEREENQFKKREMLESESFRAELPHPERENEQEDEAETETERESELEKTEPNKVEIQSQFREDGRSQFEFKTGRSKAQFQGAELTIDPVTKNVTVTTPSGQQHELEHMPDDVVEKLKEKGIVSDLPLVDTNFELRTTAEGDVVYQAEVIEPKKLFGMTVNVKKKIEFFDKTGVLTESNQPANFLERILFTLAE